MAAAFLMRAFVALVALLSVGGLVYVYADPPASMRVSRDGVPYFTPPVINPETGQPIAVDALVRRYKGL